MTGLFSTLKSIACLLLSFSLLFCSKHLLYQITALRVIVCVSHIERSPYIHLVNEDVLGWPPGFFFPFSVPENYINSTNRWKAHWNAFVVWKSQLFCFQSQIKYQSEKLTDEYVHLFRMSPCVKWQEKQLGLMLLVRIFQICLFYWISVL